ncbi:6272_t:CDS:2 [Scutellospora calospora]|uniref:6272_t:CDS:1 n=1 Tax=Scutellospora calospora TaxID=85575 RepID=A0ACA9K6Y6_9GLOM|nr:6272_t:CDS:2 [Scutellospora calospora]
MGRISSNIKEGSKVTILGSVVGNNIAHPLLGAIWKTKRLSATILQAASGTNRWVLSLDDSLETEIEVSAGRMKLVAASA